MTDKRLKDKDWRINHLYKIRNQDGKLIQFKLNRAQQHFHNNLHTRNLILKSRQLGFTTYEAITQLDDVLFTPNQDVLLIAHNLEAGESIFGKKISFAWEKFPQTLKNLYKVDNKTSKTLKFDFGKKGFSSVAVDTSGRSGTYQRVHITEFADLCKKYPKKVPDIIEGTFPAVPMNGRIDIESTSQGCSGEFYDMCMIANGQEPRSNKEWKLHFYNWQWDDEKLGYYKDKKLREYKDFDQGEKFEEYAARHKLTLLEMNYYYDMWISMSKNWNALKREYPTTVEEAFEAIAEGTYYGETIGRMERDGQIGIVPWDKSLKVHTVWDLGVGKNMVVGFFQREQLTNQIRMIDYMEGEMSDGLAEIIPRVLKKPYLYGKHFGPHDLETTDIGSGQTRRSTARKLGLNFTIVPDYKLEDGINATSIWLERLLVDKEKCKEWIRSMKNYGREWDDKKAMYRDVPKHDWASHGADMGRYASLTESQMTNESFRPPAHFKDITVDIWRE